MLNGHGTHGGGGQRPYTSHGASLSASHLQRLYRLKTTRDKRRQSSRPSRARTAVVVAATLLVGFLVTSLAFVLLTVQTTATAYAMLTRDLPSLSSINEHTSFKTAQIFDRKGQLLWELYDPQGGRRTVVPLSEISQNLIDATLAAEDAFFYQHRGVDLRATLRSAFLTGSGESRTGASTITQQLVRGVVLSPAERQQVTITRKLREIILAYQLDEKLSKDQILEMYLNEVYYGNNSYGVEAASQDYFDKHARDLSLAEAALVAGLVQSPSEYDPTRTDEVARTSDGIPLQTKERQAYVLDQMARHGFITDQQARDAYQDKLVLKERQVELKAPHWVMYVRDLVEQKYGAKTLYQGGLKIYTSLDLDYSERMLQVLRDARQNIVDHGGNNAALIAVNPKTGEILGYQGSMDYNDESIEGQVDVLRSERQPGSSIKPVIYSASFLAGWAPGTPIDDVPTCWKDTPTHQWCPVNFDNTFHGPTTVRSALGNSLNIPAVKTLDFVGVPNVVDVATQMGITTWGPGSDKTIGLSLTLGGAEIRPVDMAEVYATLANNGLRIPLVAVTRIVDADGMILEDYKVPQGDPVLDPRAAYMITNTLSDPAAKLFTYGPNTPLVLKDRPAASKTGTTDNYRDTWTDGYTPNLAIVVWVGNTDGHPMREVLSSMTAGKIWPEAMKASFDALHLPVEDFKRPEGLVEGQVCGDTRMRPGAPLCRNDLFMVEHAPKGPVTAGPVPPKPAPVATAAPSAVPADTGQPAQPPPQSQPQAPPAGPQPTAAPKPAAPPAPAATPAPAPAPPPQPQPATKPQAPAAKPTAAPQPQPTPKPR